MPRGGRTPSRRETNAQPQPLPRARVARWRRFPRDWALSPIWGWFRGATSTAGAPSARTDPRDSPRRSQPGPPGCSSRAAGVGPVRNHGPAEPLRLGVGLVPAGPAAERSLARALGGRARRRPRPTGDLSPGSAASSCSTRRPPPPARSNRQRQRPRALFGRRPEPSTTPRSSPPSTTSARRGTTRRPSSSITTAGLAAPRRKACELATHISRSRHHQGLVVPSAPAGSSSRRPPRFHPGRGEGSRRAFANRFAVNSPSS